MLSDEEKQAIKGLEWSQQQMRLGNLPDYDQGHYADIRIVLNLIEKQQKEIEELKSQIDEHVYYDLGGRSCGKTELLRHYKKGYDMNNKFWKDKIKAKIEEYKKQQKEEPDAYLCIKVLSSLLEKE